MEGRGKVDGEDNERSGWVDFTWLIFFLISCFLVCVLHMHGRPASAIPFGRVLLTPHHTKPDHVWVNKHANNFSTRNRRHKQACTQNKPNKPTNKNKTSTSTGEEINNKKNCMNRFSKRWIGRYLPRQCWLYPRGLASLDESLPLALRLL